MTYIRSLSVRSDNTSGLFSNGMMDDGGYGAGMASTPAGKLFKWKAYIVGRGSPINLNF